MTLLRILLVLTASVAVAYSQEPTTPTGQRVLEHVKYLASDECAGRAPATDGIERAAVYVVDQFKEFDLEPAGDHGTYRNLFSLITDVKLTEPNSVWFSIRRARPGIPIEKVRPTKVPWKLGEDYHPFGFSDPGTVEGEIVFCGYGLSPNGMDYDDYEGVDVKGKVVVVLRGLPTWAEKNPHLRPLASLRSKTTLARDKGAAAICFVNEKGDSSDVLDRFMVNRMGKDAGIIALQVRRTPCAKIFPPEVPTLFVAEETINTTEKPQSFVLPNSTVKIETNLEYISGNTYNLIGMVEGTDDDLRSQYVVIGAHYDHLGLGGEGSRAKSPEPAIHYGADDNGSGTAGVIELARRFSEQPTKRSVVFMAYSAEEKGLLGSKHWVSTPTMPLENVVAMMNMDMIGRLKNEKLNVHGTGTSDEWQSILDSASSGSGLTVSTTADGFGPSDHASFTPKKVPVLHFFTGLHTDYHRPSDTWEKLDYDGEARILDVIESTVRQVADADNRIAFKAGAEKPPAKKTSGGFRVTLGIIPDYSDDPNGLRIDGVRENTPAEKAGMEDGDIMVKFGETTIKNIYDLTAALTSAVPGDIVDIVVLRDGKEVTLTATLEGR